LISLPQAQISVKTRPVPIRQSRNRHFGILQRKQGLICTNLKSIANYHAIFKEESVRRFFVSHPIGESTEVNLTGSDAVHITTVLRMQPGDRLLILDGSGWEYEGHITSLAKKQVNTRIESRKRCTTEPRLQLTVAQALLKEKKMDRLVRRLTELGAVCLIPYYAQRSVPRPAPQRWNARTERWKRITREAMKQCRRGRTLELAAPQTWSGLLASARDFDLTVLFWEHARTALSAIAPDHPPETTRRILVILGPEGGFDPAEVSAAKSQNIRTATLGPRILRADTAALAACTLTQYQWGDIG